VFLDLFYLNGFLPLTPAAVDVGGASDMIAPLFFSKKIDTSNLMQNL